MTAIAEPLLRGRLARLAEGVRRVIGVPDYALYLAHHCRCHPGETALTPEAFVRDALTRRYSEPGNRCC